MNLDVSRPTTATSRRGASFACVAMLLVLASGARAEELETTASTTAQRRVVMLQSDDGRPLDPALVRDIDRLTLEAMIQRAGFARAYASPVPFADVELAAGCSGRDAGCLQRIAATLEADWLMVRELAREPSGRVYLTLIAHDGPSAIVTRRAVAEVAKSGPQAPQNVVPLLVERLYPGHVAEGAGGAAGHASAAAARAAERPDFAALGPSPAKIVGWTSVAAGGALLVAGVVVGTLAQRDEREYAELDVHKASDVDGARDLFARAQRRTDIANGLMFGGAGAGAVGVAALLWDYFRPKREERVSVRVGPARGGVALSLRARLQGGL